MKTTGWIIGFMLLYLPVWGQVPDSTTKALRKAQTEKYIYLGIGGQYSRYQDFGTAPLTYDGILGAARIGYRQQRPGSFFDVGTNPSSAFVSTEAGGFTYSATQVIGQGNVTYLTRIGIPKWQDWNLYVGPNFINIWNARFNSSHGNAIYTYEIISSLCVGGRLGRLWSYTNKKGKTRKWRLATQLSLPILNVALRPDYVVIEDFSSGRSNPLAGDGFEVAFWGKVNRLQWLTEGYYYLNNGNALRVSYQWDGYNSRIGENDSAAGIHGLTFSILFHLNKGYSPS
ncbi:hypothetical protein [Pontibacter sp. G13]|uniref:hypothetical protein n=1 Tax=Pontibacter sp. G13 TaxID=3074898 RepID=UPI002889E231|nr:hypothetical protein [Pontibacter sp. G13]WNJ18961.1 hypothetical protein RJD25_00600 [Pontibacter sp. G13]